MICPKCRSRATGRIGQNQYYCWDCNIEFVPTRDGFRMYRLEPDGTTILDSLDSTASHDILTATPGIDAFSGATGVSTQVPDTPETLQDKDPV